MSGAIAPGSIVERQVPLARRSTLRYAAFGAVLGLGLSLLIAFGVFGAGDYREPERPVEAAGIGETFTVGNASRPDAEVTVMSATRSVFRTSATVTVQIRYRALREHSPTSSGWDAEAAGRILHVSSDLWSAGADQVDEGDVIEESIGFSGPASAPISLTYAYPLEDEPRFTLVVQP